KLTRSRVASNSLLAAGRSYLRVDTLREEQRAMPAYEEPPVLPGGSFFCESRQKVDITGYFVKKAQASLNGTNLLAFKKISRYNGFIIQNERNMYL
ncbi:MAG: hypothetical protein IKU07_04370, partial [Oscillospiraceae bacterium]|nr:hypothetical protein [Oscillospiraceae bacterium]